MSFKRSEKDAVSVAVCGKSILEKMESFLVHFAACPIFFFLHHINLLYQKIICPLVENVVRPLLLVQRQIRRCQFVWLLRPEFFLLNKIILQTIPLAFKEHVSFISTSPICVRAEMFVAQFSPLLLTISEDLALKAEWHI